MGAVFIDHAERGVFPETPMRHVCIAAAACTALIAGSGAVSAQPYRPLHVTVGHAACTLGYVRDETGRCRSNSVGFGVDAYPLGYSVGPFAVFAPLYGRPYRVVARDGISEYVAGE